MMKALSKIYNVNKYKDHSTPNLKGVCMNNSDTHW